jgi:ubiquinone/menaquinone biosynthesis C-methylase UbiE
MTDTSHYATRGGAEGKQRLRVLARVMHSSTTSLLERLGVGDGMRCLDVGGGDITLELARRVGPRGTVIGADLDETKLDLARRDAAGHGITNAEFRHLDIRLHGAGTGFDLVYSRFLLTHLADPARTLTTLASMGWRRPSSSRSAPGARRSSSTR